MADIRNLWLEMKSVLRSARLMINAELEPLFLTGAEGDILFHLMTGSNAFSQEQLAQQLDIGKAAISRVVDSLEAKGYIQRLHNPEDKRAYIVCLTDKAVSIGRQVVGVYDRLYKRVKNGIAEEELALIESLLRRVTANLETMEEP